MKVATVLALLLATGCAWADSIFDNFGPNHVYASTGLQVSLVFPFDKAPIAGFTVAKASPGNVGWRIREMETVLDSADPLFYGVIFNLVSYDPASAYFQPEMQIGQFVSTGGASLMQISSLFSPVVYPGEQLALYPETVPNSALGIWHYNVMGDQGPVSASSLNPVYLTNGTRPVFRVVADPVPEPAGVVLLATVACALGLAAYRRGRGGKTAPFGHGSD